MRVVSRIRASNVNIGVLNSPDKLEVRRNELFIFGGVTPKLYQSQKWPPWCQPGGKLPGTRACARLALAQARFQH